MLLPAIDHFLNIISPIISKITAKTIRPKKINFRLIPETIILIFLGWLLNLTKSNSYFTLGNIYYIRDIYLNLDEFIKKKRGDVRLFSQIKI